MLKIHECENSYDNIGRIYHTPLGKFYSVTTMLSHSGDKGFLDEWRARVGIEEAERFTRVAAQMGTDFHQLGEDYLLKKELSKVQWMARHMFNTAIPSLDKHVTKVHAVEMPLWSAKAKIAGRTDAIVDWDDELAVFDYKCIGHSNPEWLEEYWIQATIYAHCLKEMYGLQAKKLVLLCANKKSLKTKYFTASAHKYSKEAVERIKIFQNKLKKGLLSS